VVNGLSACIQFGIYRTYGVHGNTNHYWCSRWMWLLRDAAGVHTLVHMQLNVWLIDLSVIK